MEENIIEIEDYVRATSISPDGRYLLLTRNNQKTGKFQIYFTDVKGDRKAVQILNSEYNVQQARFSPDGRWIVYLSDESGKNEVYIQPFREEGAKYQISSHGGTNARWHGSEIFFESDNKWCVVQVSIAGKVPTFGNPKELFNSGEIDIFDVAKDGKNFLSGRSPSGSSLDFISLIDNWENLAKKK
jgi:Tol biopolymer transport system component